MLSLEKNRHIPIAYEAVMAVLALIAVFVAFLDLTQRISISASNSLYYLDSSILTIFAADYFSRLIISKDKRKFFTQNIFDLLAIIPFSSLFRAFRLARLFKFVRFVRILKVTSLLILFKRLLSRVDGFVRTNGFIYILYLTIVTIVLGSAGIYYFELGKTVDSFGDALWWSFVTATTVGYGDISPTTAPGRIIAALLMLTGIGFIGMLTGTIATYFVGKKQSQTVVETKSDCRIIDLSDLGENEFNEVIRFVEFVKHKR